MKNHVITVKQKNPHNYSHLIKYLTIVVTKISAISIFFLYYFTDQFNAEFDVNIDNIKWHLLLVIFIKVITPTTFGIILIGIFYSFGIASVLNKIDRFLKEKAFKSFIRINKSTNSNFSIMSFRDTLKIAKNKSARINNNKMYKYLALKYKVFSIFLFIPIFICFILLLVFFIDKDVIVYIKHFSLTPQKTFDNIFYSLTGICALIIIPFEFLYKYENMKMIRQNKLISNPNSKIFTFFIPIALYPVAWLYLLLFSTIYQINAVDPSEFILLVVLLTALTMAFLNVRKIEVKILIIFISIFTILISPIGYFAFKYNLNRNIYISHDNNYILIDKECYLSNKQLLDLNQVAHKYLSTESFYYIESFTKLINHNKLILRESPEIKHNKIKYYGFNLVNCKNIIVEDCIESFNNVCSKSIK